VDSGLYGRSFLGYYRPNLYDRNVINVSEKPSFPAAFKWVWANINNSDFVIHLEDDWLLKRPANVSNMISILNSEDDLALLRMPLFQSQENKMKNWNLMYPWNGRYFECPKEYIGRAGFCGHPSLIKSQFVRNCAKHIKTNLNPEKQFHELNVALKTEVCKWRYGVYGSPNEAALIEDIGRKWMIKNNFRKSGMKGWFKNWVKIKEAENEQKA